MTPLWFFASEALEMDLHRAERFMQEMGSKISSQDPVLAEPSLMSRIRLFWRFSTKRTWFCWRDLVSSEK